MRICIAAFPYDKGRSGIWEYISKLIENLVKFDRENEYIIFTPVDLKLVYPNVRQIVLRNRLINHPWVNIAWHQVYLPFAVMKFKIDVLHLMAGHRRGIFVKPCRTVITIHDLWQFHIREKYGLIRFLYARLFLPGYLRGAARIIAISTSTKKDIVRFLGIPEGTVDVIPVGIDDLFLNNGPNAELPEKVLGKYGISGKYIFYVSRLEHPGKNHIVLIEAFEALRKSAPDPYKLVLAGEDWNGADVIRSRAGRSPFAADIVFTGYLPKEELPYFYRNAELFVFPSRHEGFGIPLAEAMASGVPVICADSSSLPEVLGGCGLVFDPGRPDELLARMKEILAQPSLRSFYAAKGLERARSFAWKEAVDLTLRTYGRVA